MIFEKKVVEEDFLELQVYTRFSSGIQFHIQVQVPLGYSGLVPGVKPPFAIHICGLQLDLNLDCDLLHKVNILLIFYCLS